MKLFITAASFLFHLSYCMHRKIVLTGNRMEDRIALMTAAHEQQTLALCKAVFPEKNFIEHDGLVYEEHRGEYLIPFTGIKSSIKEIDDLRTRLNSVLSNARAELKAGPAAADSSSSSESAEAAHYQSEDEASVHDEQPTLMENLEQHLISCLRASNPPKFDRGLVRQVFKLDRMAVQKAITKVIRLDDDESRCERLFSDVQNFIYDSYAFESELPGYPYGVLRSIFNEVQRGPEDGTRK